MKSALTACMVCLACLACIAVPAAANGEVIVEPAAITGTLAAGGTEEALITITLPESVPKGDVVFAMDTTGIMGYVLDALESQGNQIMADIRLSIPDSRFGVVSFMDYPQSYSGFQGYNCKSGDVYIPCTYGIPENSDYRGDYAYKVDQDLTANLDEASAAFSRLYQGEGADTPEDYTRVLYESQFLPWRTDAKKILLVFGDAPPHAAPSGSTLMKPWATSEYLFTGKDAPYGGDPGRDEVAYTADDLDYAPVIQEIANQHITIVGIYCPYQASPEFEVPDAASNFRYMSEMTNGIYVKSSSTADASLIASQIVSMIQTMAKQPVRELSLQVREEGYRTWVTSPDSYTDVPWYPSPTLTFTVALTPPAGTADGTYSFTIDIIGDGVVLGSVPVTLQVTGGEVEEPLTVSLDIKPGSCPNSFNPKEKGVLPVAILGSGDLKVTDIDRASLLLTREGGEKGVAPLRSSLEDVGSPSEMTCSCGIRLGKEDRKKDLALKFDSQELVKTLGITKDEGCVKLTITGVLESSDPAMDGSPFTGSDYLRVLSTGQGSCGKEEDDHGQGSCDHGKDGGCDRDGDGSGSGGSQGGKGQSDGKGRH